MEKIIALMNNKGWFLKTTLAASLVGILLKIGEKLLLVDITKTRITKSIKASNAMTYEKAPLTLTNNKSKQKQQYFNIVKELRSV